MILRRHSVSQSALVFADTVVAVAAAAMHWI